MVRARAHVFPAGRRLLWRKVNEGTKLAASASQIAASLPWTTSSSGASPVRAARPVLALSSVMLKASSLAIDHRARNAGRAARIASGQELD